MTARELALIVAAGFGLLCAVVTWAYMWFVALPDRIAAAVEDAQIGGCVICGRWTTGNLSDERLPRWICSWPRQCVGLWRDAEDRHGRGEYLPTVPAAGWLAGIQNVLGGTTTSLPPEDPDRPYDPDEDAPWSVVDEFRPTPQLARWAGLAPGPAGAGAMNPGIAGDPSPAAGPGALGDLADDPDMILWDARANAARCAEIVAELAELGRALGWRPVLPPWEPAVLVVVG